MVEQTGVVFHRITSYNVCYTKLLRYTINPGSGHCTFEFDAMPDMLANGACGTAGCFWPPDGIDYDDRDDTIRISPDGTQIIYNFAPDGTLVSQIGPIDFSVCAPGPQQSSGVATGVSNIMYTATNGCQEIIKLDKDTGLTLGSFPIVAERNEGMECDSVTFSSQGTDAVWVKDLDGPIQASYNFV